MSTAKRLLALLLCLLALPAAGEGYVPTNRDSRYEVTPMAMPEASLDAYELLYETASAAYYYREDRDIIAVLDRASGYVWKTGLDAGFPNDIKDAVKKAATDEEKILAAEPLEQNLNARYIGIANSILTAEFYEAETIKYISSASREGAVSTLKKLDELGNFALEVDFEEIGLQVRVDIRFEEKGITYRIPFDGMSGAGLARLAALWITPFLGASGGEAQYFDPAAMDYGDTVKKPAVPGYVLVPDGPGALIRFRDNPVSYKEYIGDVYGPDLAAGTYYYSQLSDALSLKEPAVPAFGIAHGHGQAAFLAYAGSGAEHLQLLVRPEENLRVKYTWAYPRFEYNSTFYRVYNRYGAGFFSLMQKPYAYDAQMSYTFLSGGEATWAGMARAYRAQLRAQNVLKPLETTGTDIPIRLDFILSDIKKGLIGPEQVVVSTASDVGQMLDALRGSGVRGATSGLIGWQDGAQTLAQPGSPRIHRALGGEAAFRLLAEGQAAAGTGVELSRDFVLVNERMLRYGGRAAQHLNTWYVSIDYQPRYPKAPVTAFSLARADASAGWVREAARRAGELGFGLAVTGLPSQLVSSHNYQGPDITLQQAILLQQEALEAAGQSAGLSLERPNLYLWPYTQRFLQAPVTGSQYVFETDNVPFLQLVLQGSMEVFGPYSNFSFYTRRDILRMMDYHTYPSFILSRQSSHLLSSTLSSDLYTTEFAQYELLVKDIYRQVNEALGPLRGWQWMDRRMLAEGVAENTYELAGRVRRLLINYTDSDAALDGVTVPALGWALAEGGSHGQ